MINRKNATKITVVKTAENYVASGWWLIQFKWKPLTKPFLSIGYCLKKYHWDTGENNCKGDVVKHFVKAPSICQQKRSRENPESFNYFNAIKPFATN
jgi:hypothetical protein